MFFYRQWSNDNIAFVVCRTDGVGSEPMIHGIASDTDDNSFLDFDEFRMELTSAEDWYGVKRIYIDNIKITGFETK